MLLLAPVMFSLHTGGGLGGMERMRERRHGNRSLEEVGQKLEEAEENNALLEHELLRVHEELSRTRRESMRNDLAQQVLTCFTGTKVLAYWYKSTNTDT